jgi:hypothetical protein
MPYAHRPEWGFWRRVNTELVLTALETYAPSRDDDDPDEVAFFLNG